MSVAFVDTTRTPDLLDALGGHLDVEAPGGMVLGWRSTWPDLRSRNGYRWPWPGGWAEAPDDGRDLTGNHPTKACPSDDVADEGIAWGRADSPVQAVREALAVLGIEVPE